MNSSIRKNGGSVGFLKFLKRDKKKELDIGMDELDVPPLPPDVKGDEFKELPELPDIPEMDESFGGIPMDDVTKPAKGMPAHEKIPKMPMEPAPDFKVPSMDMPMDIPKPVKFPELPKSKPSFEYKAIEKKPEIKHKVPEPPVHEVKKESYERFEKRAVREERGVLSHKEAGGKTYLRIDRFRNVLRNISDIRNEVRNADEILSKMEEIDVNRDRSLEKWKGNMKDLQKKLIFVDETLFKK